MALSLDRSLDSVRGEVERASIRWADFSCTHEALGVLFEEFHELTEAIRANALGSISHEAMQVSAVALRLHDVCERAMAGQAGGFKERSGCSK
jgi:hypothetical protein